MPENELGVGKCRRRRRQKLWNPSLAFHMAKHLWCHPISNLRSDPVGCSRMQSDAAGLVGPALRRKLIFSISKSLHNKLRKVSCGQANVVSRPVRPGPVWSGPIRSGLVRSDLVRSGPVRCLATQWPSSGHPVATRWRPTTFCGNSEHGCRRKENPINP